MKALTNHPVTAALALEIAAAVNDWEVRELLDEAAWDAADELTPYTKPGQP